MKRTFFFPLGNEFINMAPQRYNLFSFYHFGVKLVMVRCNCFGTELCPNVV